MFGTGIALDPGKEINLRRFFRAHTNEGFVDSIVSLVEGAPVEIKEGEQLAVFPSRIAGVRAVYENREGARMHTPC
jgi:hypothetical protein